MNNTMQLYIDKKREIKGYPVTSPDRVIDENGVSIKEQLDTKVNKSELTNSMTPKGEIEYINLPRTNNEIGDYYFCKDGDGTNGSGNYCWNGTTWYYAGNGDNGYNILSKRIDNYFYTDKSINLFDKNSSETHRGYYYKGTDSGTVELVANDTYACFILPIEHNETYTFDSVAYTLYFLEEDMQLNTLKCASGTTTFCVDTLSGTPRPEIKYAVFSFKISKIDSFMLVKGDTLPTTYIEYYNNGDKIRNVKIPYSLLIDTPEIPEIPEIPETPKNEYEIYNIGTDYSTLTECLSALKDNTSKKIIYIPSGIYNLYEEQGGDERINNIPIGYTEYRNYDYIIPPNTKIIGKGMVVYEWLPTIDIDSSIQSLISPFSIENGDIEIENITIKCTKCRYAIHDQSTEEGHYTHKYKNVILIKDSGTSVQGKSQAFGCGFYSGAVFEFDSCYFESRYRPISFHNGGTTSYGSITIKNCAFIMSQRSSSYNTVRFGNVSGNQSLINVMISNTYFNNGIEICNESSVERPNAFDLTLLNCSGNNEITVKTATNIYEPKIFN